MTVEPPTTAFARRLRQAELDGTAVPLASEEFDDLGWDTARQIALGGDELRRADGDVCIGYKLGWTSAAMREALGIDRPNWGTLWQSQLLRGDLDLAALRHPKVEPEIVYVAGDTLNDPATGADDVLRAAAGWSVGIEVVNPRWSSYEFTWLDNTADNSSAAAVAIGDRVPFAGSPADEQVTFSNGEVSHVGKGNQAMGDPAIAVAWLVAQLAGEGRSLEAGHVVFTGGLTAPFDVGDGMTFRAQSANLGTVEITAHAS